MEYTCLSDVQLLERFHDNGCEASFKELILRYGPLVLGAAQRILGGSTDAEDAAQVAFIALALRSKQLHLKKGLGAWLHVVATRVALDMRRKTLRRLHREATSHEFSNYFKIVNPLEERLDEAINTLPNSMRLAVISFYLEGSSIGEISTALGETPGAITMRLARARELLKRKLKATDVAAVATVLSSSLRASTTLNFVEGVKSHALMAATATQLSKPMMTELIECAHRALRPSYRELSKSLLAAILLLTAIVPIALLADEQAKPPSPDQLSKGAPLPLALSATPTQSPDHLYVDPPLIAAVKQYTSFEEGVKFVKVLDASPNINSIRDKDGKSPLHWAVITRQQDYTAILLRRGTNPNARDLRGWTPLMYATKQGDIMIMLSLILGGADPNLIANEGWTALSIAIQQGAVKAAEILLWSNANPSIEGIPKPLQPSTIAATKSTEIKQLLDDYIAQRNSINGSTVQNSVPSFVKDAIHKAAARGDFQSLTSLLETGGGANVRDDKGRTPLFDAIRAGRAEVVFYLLMMGADPNVSDIKGVTPLDGTMGWLGYDLDAMRYFLFVRGANPFMVRGDGHTELTWAVVRDNGPGVQFLLWLHADPRQSTVHGTPFQIAVNDGSKRMIDLLRRYGVDEPIKLEGDPNRQLLQAAKLGDLKEIETALKAGADINTTDKDGNPAIFWAIFKRNVPAARYFIDKGVSVNTSNTKNGTSLLLSTICWDYPEMTDFREEILKAGANINYAKPSDGITALMAAAWHTPTAPLKQLIQHGADLNVRDKKGKTVVQHATEDGNIETAEFLRQQGATE